MPGGPGDSPAFEHPHAVGAVLGSWTLRTVEEANNMVHLQWATRVALQGIGCGIEYWGFLTWEGHGVRLAESRKYIWEFGNAPWLPPAALDALRALPLAQEEQGIWGAWADGHGANEFGLQLWTNLAFHAITGTLVCFFAIPLTRRIPRDRFGSMWASKPSRKYFIVSSLAPTKMAAGA